MTSNNASHFCFALIQGSQWRIACDIYRAHKAVDGIYNPVDLGLHNYASVTILSAPDPWMVINLESSHCVKGVKMWSKVLMQPLGKLFPQKSISVL